MANYEYQNDVGTWFFHSAVTFPKLDRMAINEEANHQNKPRTAIQYESTFEVTGENQGAFVEITRLEPDYTAILFGVQVIDSDEFAGDVSSSNFLFPTGAGLGPFLRPPVMKISGSAFSVPDANGGASWQTADVSAAVDATATNTWFTVAIGQPFVAGGLDNYKNGIALLQRIAGFDGDAPISPSAARNYYIFWHAIGPVAEYL